VLNLSPVFAVVPPEFESPGDAEASARSVARSYDDTLFGIWLRALGEGLIDVPGRPRREVPGLVDTYDLVGFSYYSAISAHPDGSTGRYPSGLPTDDFDRAMWPEGLGLVLRRLSRELPGRPRLVAECGVATDDDNLRTEILGGLVDVTLEARADGVDVRGLFVWSPIDGWEWDRGFGAHFGIADRDRNLRPSASVLRDRIRH
jgi:beta-glucosidase